MDAVALITRDHRTAERLFQRLRQAPEHERRPALDRLIRELWVHSTIEDEILYPSLREVVPPDESSDRNLQGPVPARSSLHELERMAGRPRHRAEAAQPPRGPAHPHQGAGGGAPPAARANPSTWSPARGRRGDGASQAAGDPTRRRPGNGRKRRRRRQGRSPRRPNPRSGRRPAIDVGAPSRTPPARDRVTRP